MEQQRPARPEDAASFITVSDPVQHSEGMNKYTSYRVDVRSSEQPNTITNDNDPSNSINPQQQNQHDDVFQNASYSAVLRRYSDFLWLYNRLNSERSGAIIPPLPEKQAVSRFSAAFIEDRRIKLEQFLRRVAVHPELYDAPSLDTFLRADDVTFHAAKNVKGSAADGLMMSMSMSMNPNMNMSVNMNMNGMQQQPYGQHPTMNVPPPPKKDGIKKWFAETKTSIAGDLVRSPDDDLFIEIERYVDRLEKQMKNVSAQASNLVKKSKEISTGLFEFGLAFNILGQSEADELGAALCKMGSTADELSNVTMQEAEREMVDFEDPLKDYLRTIQAVKLALQRRHEKRLTYTTCLSEVNVKRSNLAKFRSTPGAEAKAYGAEMSLKRGEAAADAAREDFATVSQRVLREVDRFKREKGEEMKRVILDYINAQIEYNKRMEGLWADLLPQLEGLAVGSANAGAGGTDNSASETGDANPAESKEDGNDPVGDSGNVDDHNGEVEDMAQPTMQQPQTQYSQQQHPHMSQQMPQQGYSNSNMYQGGGINMEGSIQYRDVNAYPSYSNVPSS